MDFFAKVFNALSDVASGLPKIDVGAFFIVVAVFLIALGIVVGMTYLSSAAGRMKRATKKILKYLDGVNEINDDNAADFTSVCFGNSAPRLLRDGWVKYLGVRFGYPTDTITEKDVFDGEVKKQSNVRSNIYIAVALILTGFLAFWAMGSADNSSIAVIVGAGLILSGIIYLILVAVGKKQYKTARELFYSMQDELDAKVDFHVEKDYSTDASPLLEMTSLIDEIVGRNTAKVVEVPTEDEQPESAVDADVPGETDTTIEKAESVEEENVPPVAAVEEETLPEESAEHAEETAEETAEEAVEEALPEETAGEVAEESFEDEVAENVEETAEETAEEVVEEPIEDNLTEEPVEEPVEEALEDETATTVADSELTAEDIGVEEASAETVPAEDFTSEERVEETAQEADEKIDEDIIDVPAIEVTAPVEVAEKDSTETEELPVAPPIVYPEKNEEEDVDVANMKIGTATMMKNKPVRNVLKDEGVNDWLAGQNEFGMASPVEAFEEVNIEDEEVMFGKKKKEAAAAEAAKQQQEQEAAAAAAAAAKQTKPAKVYAESEVFLESELVVEEKPVEVKPVEAPAPVEATPAPAPAPAVAPVEEEIERPEFKRTLVTAAPVQELEPEVVEEYENLDEGDEDIKAPRLSKLPHLVDYVLSTNVSRATKVKVAQLMFQAYVVFKNSPENKAIVIQCLMKVMNSLKPEKAE